MPISRVRDDREAGLFRVHRSSMTSQEILDLERDLIFDRCWLYLGHSSELPEPGDYRRRSVAGRSIIFVRGDDGEIRAFHNTCPHRGAIVCRHDEGNAKAFQCFYHAWTFNSRGKLTGIPGKDAYEGGCFDPAERSLKPVARLEGYRGFWFVSFRRDIESLSDYLAGAKDYLDLLIDQSLDGELKIVPGTHRYSIRANWKLLCENSIDGYHGLPTHQTYFNYVIAAGGVGEGSKKLFGSAHSLGNGHAVINYWSPWGRPVARWVPQMGEEAKPEIEAIRRELVERHGPERADQMAEWNRNMLIYPNLVINDIMATTVRTFDPVRPDLMEINAWALAPAEETGHRLQVRLHNFLEFLGPGGFATPDDVEALDSCQLGFNAGGEEWNDVSRGMHREPQFDDELQMRVFWRQWAADIEQRPIDRWDDGPRS
jgi:p-cumate 2,3-dioxygenase subunit alpha